MVTDDTFSNKGHRIGRPTTTAATTMMQRNETTSYVLYCPNGRKVLLPSDGIVDVAQLCLWVDDTAQSAQPVNSLPTPPSESQPPQTPKTKALPLVSSGPPQPIRISAYEPLPVRDLVRLSSHFHFLLTPPNNSNGQSLDTSAPIEVAKAISLVCPEARLGTNTPPTATATETGHLVAHVSRLSGGRWYCRRTPSASVPLMWPANTTLSLPVTQPLPMLALPRKLIVHVGPEVGPGAPPPPELHEEFIGGGMTYMNYGKMGTLEVVLNPLKGQVFTIPGPDIEADNARLEAEREARVARLERVQRPMVDEDETEEDEKEKEKGTQTSSKVGQQEYEHKGKEPARPAPSSRQRHRRTSSSTSTTSPSKPTPKKRTHSGSVQRRELIAKVRKWQGAPIPAPMYPRTGGQGPHNPLADQKNRTTVSSPPPRGPDLPRFLSKAPGQDQPQRLPPLRGFIREMDVLVGKQQQALLERRTAPLTPPTPTSTPSSSQLPQCLHQYMRQAPVQDRDRYGKQLGKTLQERHLTFEDRIHGINLKPKPKPEQQQQQSVRPVQQKKKTQVVYLQPPMPSQELMEMLPPSMQRSIQTPWSWQNSTTGSDDSYDD